MGRRRRQRRLGIGEEGVDCGGVKVCLLLFIFFYSERKYTEAHQRVFGFCRLAFRVSFVNSLI
uniref:Uncharacterized protein n=1 Tax=Arundo donax TaxID=35708 RepID=A0A0A8YPW0_ARUDO